VFTFRERAKVLQKEEKLKPNQTLGRKPQTNKVQKIQNRTEHCSIFIHLFHFYNFE